MHATFFSTKQCGLDGTKELVFYDRAGLNTAVSTNPLEVFV